METKGFSLVYVVYTLLIKTGVHLRGVPVLLKAGFLLSYG